MPKVKRKPEGSRESQSSLRIVDGLTSVEIRERLGFSVGEFAGALCVRDYTVERWERGENKPSPMAQERIRRLLSEVKAKVKK
jgi:DNA-binding transcriptional regulator YiaG